MIIVDMGTVTHCQQSKEALDRKHIRDIAAMVVSGTIVDWPAHSLWRIRMFRMSLGSDVPCVHPKNSGEKG
jgi:hypothetical protein